MQKLILPLLFSFILFFFSGCQSETPISPSDQEVTLDKVKALPFTGENIVTMNGTINVKLDWPAFRNVAGYKIIYYNLLSGRQLTHYVEPSVLSYTVSAVMLQHEGSSCEITVQAYKLRKGAEIILYQGTQTFNYTGTYLGNITFTASILDNSPSEPSVYINQISPWTAYSDIRYAYMVFPSWGSQVIDAGSYLWIYPQINVYLPPHTSFSTNDFVVVTLYMLDSDGKVTNIGNQKVFYTL